MIAVETPKGIVIWQAGSAVVMGVETPDPDPDFEATVLRKLRTPVAGLRGIERRGVIERIEVTLPPGTSAHARAALLGLPGAKLLSDDEP